MLTSTQLVGFNAIPITYVEGSDISGATNIGNLTAGGGLAAAFDGTTSQAGGASAGLDATASGYVGKNYSAAPKRIFKAVVYGSNNAGYFTTNNPQTTITLYGKNGGAPGSETDGISLGTVNFTDTLNESGNPRTINNGGELSTQWDYVWVQVARDDASASDNLRVTEVTFTEAVIS